MNLIQKLKTMPLGYKFHFGLALYIASIVILGGISYTDLLKIDDRIESLTRIDRLNSEILEVRRYEKNYFLYLNPGDLIQTKDYASRTVKIIDDLLAVEHKEYMRLDELRSLVNEYMRRLNSLSEVDVIGLEADKLRATDKSMVNMAKNLS